MVGDFGILILIQEVDRDLAVWLNTAARQLDTLHSIMFHLLEFDLLKGVPFMGALWYFWFKDEGVHRNAVTMVLIAAVLAVAISRVAQHGLPERPRPLHDVTLPLVLPDGLSSRIAPNYGSFPSDHAALFIAMSVAMFSLSRALGIAALLWSIAIVCFPRAYLGVHYPFDLLGGGLIGMLVVCTVKLTLQHWPLHGIAVAAAGRWPAAFHALAFVVTFELGRMANGVSTVLKLAGTAFQRLF